VGEGGGMEGREGARAVLNQGPSVPMASALTAQSSYRISRSYISRVRHSPPY